MNLEKGAFPIEVFGYTGPDQHAANALGATTLGVTQPVPAVTKGNPITRRGEDKAVTWIVGSRVQGFKLPSEKQD